MLHQLDTKRTQELNYAKTEIRKLTDDLPSGTKRLFVKPELHPALHILSWSIFILRC
ncbi:MAG: lysis system i-spanin subunit Rz [Arsenophonus endosymbiont of Dermacentor nuttalli]